MNFPDFPPDPFDNAISYRRRLAQFLSLAPMQLAIVSTEKSLPFIVKYKLNESQHIVPITLLFTVASTALDMSKLVADVFQLSQEEGRLLFVASVSQPEVVVTQLQLSPADQEKLLSTVISKRGDISQEISNNQLYVQELVNGWNFLRQPQFSGITVSGENFLGEKRILAPTFKGKNIPPSPDDLLLLMDNCVPSFEIPLIIGQKPGCRPIIKFSPKRQLQRSWFKMKRIRRATIFGVILVSTITEKRLVMRFHLNLERGLLFYHYESEAAGGVDLNKLLAKAFPLLEFGKAAPVNENPRETGIALGKSADAAEEEADDAEEVSGVQFYFMANGISVERTTLYELSQRLPIFYRYCYMNEIHHSLPKSKNPFIYFHFADDPLPEIRVKANQVDRVNRVAEVKITTSDALLIAPFIRLFVQLMGIVNYYQTSVINYYSQLLNYQFQPIVEEKELHYQKRELAPVAQNLLLSTKYPELFSEGYDHLVPPDRRPLILLAGQQQPQEGDLLVSGYLLRCPTNFPYIRNKDGIYLCYPEDNPLVSKSVGTGAGITLSPKFSQFITPRQSVDWIATKTPLAKVSETRQMIKSVTVRSDKGDPFADLNYNSTGVIAHNLRYQLVKVYPEYEDTKFFRMGTPKIAHSLIFATLMSVQDPVLYNLEDKSLAFYTAYMRKQLEKIHPECCRQQLWSYSNEQIRKELLDLDTPLDSFYHLRAVEELFGLNIIVFTQSKHYRQDYEIETPAHIGPYFPHIRPDRPTILLLKRTLDASYASANPHYEPIFQINNKSGALRVFGSALSKHFSEILAYWNQVHLFTGRKTFRGIFQAWDPYQLFDRGVPFSVDGQLIDSYGKQRGILINYSDGVKLSIFGPPRAPENLVERIQNFPAIAQQKLSSIISMKPVARSVYQGKTIGVWYQIFQITEIFIPIVPEEVYLDLPIIACPYVSYVVSNFEDQLEKYIQLKKMQITLLSILQWLFTLRSGPQDGNWFILQPGEYELKDLPAQLPLAVNSWEQAVAYLAGKTKGLIVQGKIRVSSVELGRVFSRFLQQLSTAGNAKLLNVPLYLSGYYKNYRELQGKTVAVADWQLRLLQTPVENVIYNRVPITIVNNKIEDSEVITRPIFYQTYDKRILYLLNMASLSKSPVTFLKQEALNLAAQFYWQKTGKAIELVNGVIPHVYYYIDKNGNLQLSKGDDFSYGRIPYLEVARLSLSDNSLYVLLVLAL